MSIQCINEISMPGGLFKKLNSWIFIHISVLSFRPFELLRGTWHFISLHLPLEHHFWTLAKSIKDVSLSAISICIFQNSTEARASMLCLFFHLQLFFRGLLPFVWIYILGPNAFLIDLYEYLVY